jgi:DNA-binding NtrC family response regulator
LWRFERLSYNRAVMGDGHPAAPLDDTLPLETNASAAPADAPRTYLLVHDGAASRAFFLRPSEELLIGRSQTAHLRSEDPSVSRLHARIKVERRQATIADLGSHNGTQVNGERISEDRLLSPGDVIAVGSMTLVYQQEAARQRRPAVLDRGEWRQRIGAELESLRRYGGSFALVVIELGAGAASRERIVDVVSAALRAADAFSLEDQQLLVLLPEISFGDATVPIERLLQALAQVAPQARAGFASSPADGLDPAALTAKARAAARGVSGGGLAPAGAATALLQVGDRQVVASAPAVAQLFSVIRRLAASDIPVLICGETGSGKEIAASALHHWSPRRGEKLLTLNCAALPEGLIESELFGYEKGAFSGADRPHAGLFEAAHGGTLLLDEVGELSAQAQAKLLRVVESRRNARLGSPEEREIDVRLVAATNRPLETEVGNGRFRKDLYFRLSAATLTVPPLRDRPQDLLVLARRFLEQACAALGRPPPSLAPATLRMLAAHSWPGNVRELKNAMDYLAATVTESVLEPDALPHTIVQGAAPAGPEAKETPRDGAAPAALGDLYEEIRQLERRRIAEALEAAGGVQVRAAELIGMPLRTFASKVRLYGLLRK